MGNEEGDDIALVKELVAAVPEFEDLFEADEFNNGGILPHVFFWDMTQEVLASYSEDPGPDAMWRRTIAFLENRLGHSAEADTVIGTSFLYSLPWPGTPGYEIVGELGPKLRKMFDAVRASG